MQNVTETCHSQVLLSHSINITIKNSASLNFETAAALLACAKVGGKCSLVAHITIKIPTGLLKKYFTLWSDLLIPHNQSTELITWQHWQRFVNEVSPPKTKTD